MSGTSDQDYLQAIQRATQKIKQLKEENAALKQGSARISSEVAVIGMGCRFPGEAQDLDSFWRVLSEGIDTISEIPAERWSLNQYFDTNSDAPGKSYAKHGAFLKDIDQFDADFFRISPKEAKAMDPQQRILLEVCWQAFEHAGLTPDVLKGSRTGTYIGISTCDYSQNHLTSGDLTQINAYSLSGVSHSTCAGRIAYLFDLHGPCLAIDTACSSSLAAMHLAIQSLRNNEIDMAIVGGVNIITRPELYVGFSKIHALSVDGKCKAFDDAANGYVRGEGCGVIILAREDFAREHQYPVLAKVKGSAINQDGETNGLTAPNAISQRELLKAALKDAHITDADMDYIEAHGTGTPLGDPIEIRALNEVYGARDKHVSPLLIGSLKTNIGHTEAAAGVASVIKTVLALMHKKIPPSLHFSRPSSQVDWSETHIDINTVLRDWPARTTPHRAGVSSFGFSGTNVHVVIEEATGSGDTAIARHSEAANILLPLSAKNNTSLQQLAKNYLEYLAGHSVTDLDGSLQLDGVCKRAALQRTHFNYRMAACGHNLDSLREDLQRQLNDAVEASNKNTAQKNIAHNKNNLVFLFTGQGSQYLGMGKEAYFHYREFRNTFEQCANLAAQYLEGDSIIELLFADLPTGTAIETTREKLQQKLNLPLYTQLSLFALEYSLARLWMSWVGTPAAVMGHSLGEYVAATIAGVFSLDDAIKLVATRARLMGQLPAGRSGMISVLADQQRVQDEIQRFGEAGLTIAGLNAPASTVVAGEVLLLEHFSRHLESASINSIAMNVSHGFHSPHMNGIIDEFKQVARTVDYRQPRIPLVSNVSGTWVDDKQLLDADYWAQHTLAPVNFMGGISSLLTLGHLRFIEIGPKPTLIQLAKSCVTGSAAPLTNTASEIDWLASLKPGNSDLQQLKQALSSLYCLGVNIHWSKYFSEVPMSAAPLPDYPFNRQSYWQKPNANSLTNAHNLAVIERDPAHPIIAETNTFDNSNITNGLMNPEGSNAMSSHVNAVSREAQFKTIIAQIIGKALEKSVDDIDPSLSFMEMGADSIIIVEALREVEELFNITISVRQIFEELTDINSLAAYIDGHIAPEWKQSNSGTDTAQATPVHPGTEQYSAPVAASAANHSPLFAQTRSAVPAQYPVAPVNTQPFSASTHVLNPVPQDNLFTQQLHVVSQAMNLIAQQLHSLQGTVPANGQYTNPIPVVPATPIIATARTETARTETEKLSQPVHQVAVESARPAPVAKDQPAIAKDKLGSLFYGKASNNTSGWDGEQAAYFEQFSSAYIAKTKTSKALAATDRKTLADSRAAIGFRLSIKEMLYLIVSNRAKGTRLWDVDGNEYLDVTMGFGVYLFGSNPDFITRVLQQNIDSMEVIGPRSHLVGKVSALMAELTGLERFTFCNSGTEAVMAAIRLARSTTKKIKIVVFDGSYHGHSDYTLAKKDKHSPYGLPLADGTPKSVAENIIVLEYGNPDSINIIRQHAHELAAVLVEPVQSRNPALQPREFLQELRRVTQDTNVCLIFDEMITGFRIHQGGAQAWFGVKADMAAYGKTIAGGLPIGVVAGSAKYMDGIDGGAWSYGDNSYPETERVFFGGTFNQHPLAMMGAYETLKYLKQQGPALQERLNRLTNSLVSQLNNYFTAVDFPLRAVNFGSLFRFEFSQNMELFFYHLLQNGIFIWEWRSGFISTAHTEKDIEFILAAVKKSVEQLRNGGFYRSTKTPIPLEQFSAPKIDSLALEKKLANESALHSESQDLANYLQAAELLNELALDYAVNALQALGLPFALNQTYALRDIAATLAIGAEQLPMLERLLGLLASAGYLYKNETYWRVVKDPQVILQRFPNRQARMDFLTSHYPDLVSELALLVRAGENLTAVLAGQNSPLQSLIYKEKENPLIHFYRNSPVLKHMNVLVGAACSSVIAAAGNINQLRFLEIGGGTAATTSYIIPMLRQRLEENKAHYTFTDISPKFLVDAKQRFSDVSNIDYRLLNVEKPEDVAAFTPHSFDVVVAVNVLHATKDIRESVRHIASLLKPGGVLLLTEGTHPVLWIDLVFGLTDGWWRFTDGDLRDGHPLISVAQWKKVLAEEGFANAFAVATPATASDLPQALIVARRNETTGTSPSGPGHDSYPLSEAQQQLLLLCKFNEDASRAYNTSLSLDLEGELNPPALNRAVNALVQRHDSLRTVFPEDAEGNCVQQRVLGSCAADIAFIDFRIQFSRDAATFHDWYEGYSSESFDLVYGPLFKVRVVQLTDQRYQLILSAHHLIIDGISLGILLQELAQEYQHNSAGKSGSTLLQKPAQYRDFIQWQSSSLNNGTLDAQRNFWKEKVAGVHEPLELPFDRRRGVIKSYQGSRLSLVVNSELRSRCVATAAQCGVTPFMFLFGVYTVLLRRFASNQEYIIGVPCAGRSFKGSENIVGYLTHLLPILVDFAEPEQLITADDIKATAFKAHLHRVRRLLADAFDHQDYPFASLLKELAPNKDLAAFPLVQTTFNLDRSEGIPHFSPELSASYASQPVSRVLVDFGINIIDTNTDLVIDVDYNTGLFDAATINRIGNCFVALLDEFSRDANQSLFTAPVLPVAERDDVLFRWGRSVVNNDFQPRNNLQATIQETVAAQVARFPNNIAVSFHGQSITYAELNEQANRVAHGLLAHSLVPGSCVAVYLPRSIEMVVALLAILKTGCAYVPLDENLPAGLINYTLTDARIEFLLTNQTLLANQLGGQDKPLLDLEQPLALLTIDDLLAVPATAETRMDPAIQSKPEDLAYIIYTSGSTGKPKGVMVEHRNLISLFLSTELFFQFDEHDVWTQFHSYAFDFSVWEIWGALMFGGRLVLVPPMTCKSPEHFYQLLHDEGVTRLNQTPSAFRQLVNYQAGLDHPLPLALQTVIFGGEALDMGSLKPWVERYGDQSPQLVNMYGITETTVHVTYRRVLQHDVYNSAGASLIGQAIPGLEIYLLDKYLQPVPVGVPGEIYVGGPGVTRGYINREALTQERFIVSPFDPSGQTRLYRSADLGRYLPNGDLEYRGRIDSQVKIRGFRIELGEVEAALRQHPEIEDAAVLAQLSPQQSVLETAATALLFADQRLVAYVKCNVDYAKNDALRLDSVTLKRFLEARLPGHMIPAAFVAVPEIPMTKNGKVDKRKLAEYAASLFARVETDFVAPSSAIEQALATIWCKNLGLSRVSVQDNFFDLGGDSISSIKVLSAARREGLNISLEQLYYAPTIAELAAQVAANPQANETVTGDKTPFALLRDNDRYNLSISDDYFRIADAYPLTALQKGMIFHSERNPHSSAYHDVLSLDISMELRVPLLQKCLAELVQQHAVLRTAFDLLHASEPLQIVYKTLNNQNLIMVSDHQNLTQAQQQTLFDNWFTQERETAFDWASAPLIRFYIHQWDSARFSLTLSFHHSILDGWSVSLLVSELLENYSNALLGRSREIQPAVNEGQVSFRDFVALERQSFADETTRAYWKNLLEDATFSPFNLPASQDENSATNTPVSESLIHSLKTSLSPELCSNIAALAKRLGVPVKSILLSAHIKVLSIVGGQQDVISGLVSNGRPIESGADRLLGLFLNTLPLRVFLSNELSNEPGGQDLAIPQGCSWQNLVKQVFQAENAMRPHRYYPLSQLIKDNGGLSLFDVAFNFVNFEPYAQLKQATNFTINDYRFYEETNFPLVVQFEQDSHSGIFNQEFIYSSARFSPAQIQMLDGYYQRVLEAMTNNWDEPHARHCFLPANEQQKLLLQWNDTAVDYGQCVTLHQLFEQQVNRTPDAIAIQFADDVLTYNQLNIKANQLAHYLIARGVSAGQPVALCCQRSPEMVIALFAILKAGGCYLPLDPTMPAERLTFILQDSGVSLVLVDKPYTTLNGSAHYQLLNVHDTLYEVSHSLTADTKATALDLDLPVDPKQAAYIIYTSGSTGTPKGVINCHDGIYNRLRWMQDAMPLDSSDRVLQKTPYTFDVSVWEFFWTLATGAALVIAKPEGHKDPYYLWSVIKDYGVTTLHFVPPMLQIFLKSIPDAKAFNLRQVICSGETLPSELQNLFFQILPDVALFNLYGPTEAAIDVTYWKAEQDHGESDVPIGYPIANTRIYLLDAWGQPVPTGVVGEIVIGGINVARGYLNRPELNREKFLRDYLMTDKTGQVNDKAGQLFKTGDLARFGDDGRIHFLGRKDYQVKIRGMRIELSDVEAAINSAPQVEQSVVILRDYQGQNSLLAYIVVATPKNGATQKIDTAKNNEIVIAQLKQYLATKLPDYMIPVAFVVMDELPLTENGKVNRKSLPLAHSLVVGRSGNYVAPQSSNEKILVDLWEHTLGITPVGVDDNFFSLGGDSILSIQVVSKARLHGITISLEQLYQHPTIRELLTLASGEAKEIAPALDAFALISAADRSRLPDNITDAYPLAELQSGMLFHSQLATGSSIYHDLFTLQLQMPIQIDYLGQALAQLVNRHAVLRTHFDFTRYSEPLQLVEHDRTPDLELIDLSHLPDQQQQEFYARWQEAEKQRHFSWDKEPPVRFFIHVKGERAIDLSISFHHAILDGWSLASLTQEWIDNYFRLLDGTGLDASKPVPVSYSNFIGLELDAKKSEASQSFWQQRMTGSSPTRVLPWQAVGDDINHSDDERLNEVVITLPDGLSNLAKQAQVPLKTILLALHLKILSSLSHQLDVVTGLVSNGRMDDGEGDSLLGLFLNTLPISYSLTDSSWHEFFHQVLRAEQDILPHRRFPLAAIQRLTGQDELFESVFNFVHFHIYREWENNQHDVKVTGAEFFEETNFALLANFELDVAVDQITLTLRYDRNKFPLAQMQSMARSYRHLASVVVADIQVEHGKASIAADEDRALILPLPELTAEPWQLIHQGVERQVERKSAKSANKNSATNRIALRSNEQAMDYATLNQKANQLAHYLRERGVGPNLRVAVFLERGFDLVISLLAILKAGGAYVPIDPASPRQRLEFILDDAQAPILLTQQSLREKIPAALLKADSLQNDRLVCVDEWAAFETYPQDNLQVAVTPDDTAYVIYTSGTTGNPKGVLVPHSNVSRLFSATREQFHFNDQDVWSLFHSCAFDFSVWELWGGLCHGGTVVIVDDLVSRSSDKFYDLLLREKVTVLNQTPSAFKQLIRQDQKHQDSSRLSLRYVIFGGEALHLPDLAPWFERHGDQAIQLINMYGITETTVHVTYKRLYQTDCDYTQSLIGLPISDLRVHILDPFKNPVPIGAIGEMHVAGAGVSPGYLNRESLSAERFINNHLCDTGTSLYCSGDLARYWPTADQSQADIEYLGRKDSQVKLRGFRIELGEIEAALKKHAGIADGVVAIHTANASTAEQHQQLVAFVVGKPGINLVANNLQQYIQQHLPAYMVPAVYEFIAHIPLTQNGKVDRNKLLAVFADAQTRAPNSRTTSQVSIPLQNNSAPLAISERVTLSAQGLERPLETLVIDVWKNVLDRTQVNPGDNFFDIGGHSLLLIRVQEKLQELLGIEFSLVSLFNYPTVDALVNFLQPLYDAVRTTNTQDHRIGEVVASAEVVQAESQFDSRDIAIIGMSGRFPGANTVDEFWQNIRAGRDCISHFNDDELRAAGISDELIHSPDYVKANGAIEHADKFDAEFFGVSHREAEIMDPQHRVFLECAWAALEDAGYCGDGHTDNIGVFAGSGSSTYMLEHVIANPQLLNSASEFQLMLGSDKDFLPSRVSYKLNLKGPSINVSTACSSSLVAVQVARQSLLNGECEIALAGGISIQGLGAGGYFYEKEGIASPDGRCRVFDKAAQGTVPGSGACIVVLKKLDAALRDKDFIHAVIKGAAINNDGFDKVGYTAPSIDGQKNVILQALGDLPASSIQYVEAHGTGTALGDPVEIEALNQAYKINAENHQDNVVPGSQRCAIGSVKANIGHLDRAAGVAGLIKTVQALKAKQIPPNIHYQQANPQIPFARGPFFVATEAQPWTVAPHQSRRAAVSSFGIGGTNAHVILEEAPEQVIAKSASKPQALITLSAKTPSALAAMSRNLEQYLRQHDDLSLTDIAFTLNAGRKTFAHRKALVVSTVDELIHQLATGENVIEPAVRTTATQKTIFMFPGQGSHYAGVATFLYETEAEFRSTIDYCAQQLLSLLGQDIRDNLFNANEESQNTALAQPILFSLCFALAKQLMSWGIQPDAMLGHSLGEYVAACLAGVFTLDDALRLIAKRGQLMAAMPQGSMLAISIGAAEARHLLEIVNDLDLAAVNAANLVVVAGDNNAIDRVKQLLDAQDITYHPLATSHAFHSRMMEPVLDSYRDFLNTISFNRSAIPFVSNLSGTWIVPEQAIDPDYWVSHLRNPVLFHQNLATLLKQDNVLLLEVGPGSQLSNLANRHPERGANAVFSCLPNAAAKNTGTADPQYRHLLGIIAAFFCQGGKWDKQAFCRTVVAQRVSLPGYPFERQSYRLSKPAAINSSDTNTRDLGTLNQNTLNQNKYSNSSSSNAISNQADAQIKMPVADWFYEYRWEELDQTLRAKNESNAVQGQPILLLQTERDCHALIQDLKTSLVNAGHTLIQVFIGAAFTQTLFTQKQSHEFELDPRQKNHFDQLATCLSEQGILPGHIIHAWHLVNDQRKASRSKKLPAKPLADSLAKGLFSLAYLTGSLQSIAPAHPFLLTLLTEGGQCVTGEEQLRPEVAIDISAIKVIAQEHPAIQCRSIDVRVKDLRGWQYQRLKDRLLEECCYPGSESELVVRGNRCWVPTISKMTAPLSASRNPSQQPVLRQQGTYFITGGLGNIGLLIAQFLVQKVDANVVLLARSHFPEMDEWADYLAEHGADDPTVIKIKRLQAIQEIGGNLLILRGDVCNRKEMTQSLALIQTRFGKLHGVFHGAAAPADNTFLSVTETTPESADAILAAKTQGVIVLDEVLASRQLDFCILLSSLAAVLGGMGFYAYAGANGFMDRFAQQHNQHSEIPWLSLNMDGWNSPGVTINPALIDERDTVALFETVFGYLEKSDQQPQQLLISATPLFPRIERAIGSGLHKTPGVDSRVQTNSSGSSTAHKRPVTDTPYLAPRNEVEAQLVQLWESYLSTVPIGVNDNIFSLGADSLLAIRFNAQIRSRYSLELSIRNIYEMPTIAMLADFIATANNLQQQHGKDTEINSALEMEEGEI